MLHCISAIRVRLPQGCFAGRSVAGRGSAPAAIDRPATSNQPRIQFSEPVTSFETRPDSYRVYKIWCEAVEDDLRSVCTVQLGLGLSETRRIVHAAREHHNVVSIFLNPARVLARLYSWRPLEQELATCRKNSIPLAAELFASQPTLISVTGKTLRTKVQHLKQVLDVHSVADTEKLAKAILRRPQMLQRSSKAISAVFHTLSERLGQDGATKTLLRFPELFSRAPKIIEQSFSAVQAEVGTHQAVRMVVSNPSMLVRKDTAARFVRVSRALDLPPEQAATVIRSLPTLLNIPPATLKRRLRLLSYGLQPWYTTPASLKPSILGRLLTAPDARLMRLSYLAFLHGFADPRRSGAHNSSDDTLTLSLEPTFTPPRVDLPSTSVIHSFRLSRDTPWTLSEGRPRTESEGLREKSAGGNSGLGGSNSLQEGNAGGASSAQHSHVLRAPLSFVIMPEDDFLSKYPRFPRWLRRKNRSLSVLCARTL